MGSLVSKMKYLEQLAARRRFGMRPGLEAVSSVLAFLGDPQKGLPVVHVAGTNGKGAVVSLLDECFRSAGLKSARYTSPHLVKLNERYFLEGKPLSDSLLERVSLKVEAAVRAIGDVHSEVTFFEALTLVAFELYASEKVDVAVFETGLGGRLDATNVCTPRISVITRIGLDHCDWLGDTPEKIASEKAGIIKPNVPIVLGRNIESVREVIEARAREVGAPFFYAPDIVSEDAIPEGYALGGSFNRENALTALAVLKVVQDLKLFSFPRPERLLDGFSSVVWPGRFQRVGNTIVDGAHNPPAARALAAALQAEASSFTLVAGFCADKDVGETLSILAPHVKKAYAVRTNNPRSLSAEDLAAKMCECGIKAAPCASLGEAFILAGVDTAAKGAGEVLVCGSLFLAGEALVALGAYPWSANRFDPSEKLKR